MTGASFSTCLEELSNLRHKAEVIPWCQSLHKEAVGEEFYRGVANLAEDIALRLEIIETIA